MTFTCVCLYCDKDFPAERSTAKFCQPAHRVAFARDKMKKKDAKIAELSTGVAKVEDLKELPKEAEKNFDPKFIPNWKRIGLKSKEDAVLNAIGELVKKKSSLHRLGLTDKVTIIWKGKTIEI